MSTPGSNPSPNNEYPDASRVRGSATTGQGRHLRHHACRLAQPKGGEGEHHQAHALDQAQQPADPHAHEQGVGLAQGFPAMRVQAAQGPYCRDAVGEGQLLVVDHLALHRWL